MKRFIAFILIISTLLSLGTFSMVNAEENNGNMYEAEIEFLKEIKLIDKNFVPGGLITRGEMADLVVKALGYGVDYDTSAEETVFSDVDFSHVFYSSIKACKDLGIVNGDYNNCFYPDNKVTVSEMFAVMINALGYTMYAQAQGGYPSGYFVVAKSSGISEGVNISEEYVTSQAAAKIIYNSIFADSVDLVGISNDGVSLEINRNKNFLSERLGIFEYDAILIDDGYTSIYGDSIENAGRIVIEEVESGMRITAFSDGRDYSDYLGMRVKIFIRNNLEDGKYETVFLAPHKRVKTVNLSASKVIACNSDYIEYDEDKENSLIEKYVFSEVTPKILLNGALITGSSIEAVMPKDGVVKLIDNDDDNKYDMLSILSFNYKNGNYKGNARNIVVDNVDVREGKEYISCLFNPSASLDVNSDEVIVRFKMSGNITSLAAIQPKSIVSVAECPKTVNGKTMYYLAVSTQVISDDVTGKSGNEIFLSANKAYELSSSITGPKKTYINMIDYGKITLYLDASGKIAYTEGAVNIKNYGYMIKARLEPSRKDSVVVSLFTKEGKVEQYELRSKVVIDGVPCDTTQKQLDALYNRYQSDIVKQISGDTVTSRPVLYKINSKGYIIEIDTDTPNEQGTADVNHLLQTSIPYTTADLENPDTLNACWRNPAYEKVSGNSRSVNGKFFLTTRTHIIAVPEIDTYGIEDGEKLAIMDSPRTQSYNLKFIKAYELPNSTENYKVVRANLLEDGAKYDIQAYNIDPDTGVAEFAVIRGIYEQGIAELSSTHPLAVFLKKTEIYDVEKEEMITRIYYSNAGKEEYCDINMSDCFFGFRHLINGASAEENIYGNSVSQLRPGDIIRVQKNSDNYLTHIERVISVENYKTTTPLTRFPTGSTKKYAGLDYGYSKSPFDYNNYPQHADSTYSLCVSYVEDINSGVGKVLMADNYKDTINTFFDGNGALKAGNPYFYINLQGMNITTVNIAENGTSAKVEKGTLDDIVTLERNNNLEKGSSLVIFRFQYFNIGAVTVINGLENIR